MTDYEKMLDMIAENVRRHGRAECTLFNEPPRWNESGGFILPSFAGSKNLRDRGIEVVGGVMSSKSFVFIAIR